MVRKVMVATLAITLALAGGAFASGTFTGKDVKDGSLTGKDVKNHSLTPADFSGSVRGATGPAGPAGPGGPAGPAGPSTLGGITMEPGGLTVAPGDVDGGTIYCAAGQRVISGGYDSVSADGEVFINEPNADRSGWVIALDNFDSSLYGDLGGYALCVPAGSAVAARAHAKGFARGAGIKRLAAARRASHAR